eukprot:gene1608-biopygen6339
MRPASRTRPAPAVVSPWWNRGAWPPPPDPRRISAAPPAWSGSDLSIQR